MYHSSFTRSPASLPLRRCDRAGRLREGCGGKNGCRRTAERVKLVPQSKECEGGGGKMMRMRKVVRKAEARRGSVWFSSVNAQAFAHVPSG
jgi:hypothetical protein